jgi:DnaK suppressor protein
MTTKKRPKVTGKPKRKVTVARDKRTRKTVVSSSRKLKPAKRPSVKLPLKPLTKEMLDVRDRLTRMLKEMRGDIDREVRGASERDLAHINDTSDMASDAAEGDLSLRIAESETVQASEIERAIEKVDNGTYGRCEVCNQAIGVDRLRFLPYVTHCIRCQGLTEVRKRDEEGEELDDLAESPENESEN